MFPFSLSPESYAWLLLVAQILAALAGVVFVLWITGTLRYIRNSRGGIVEKLWSPRGSLAAGLIALEGEAGYQPDVMRGGLHLMVPLQYRVHIVPLVTIAQGHLGYVFARDGQPLPATQTLAANTMATVFTDAGAFLRDGGQRGPQRHVLREGTYAINLAQFGCIALGLSEDLINAIQSGDPRCPASAAASERRTPDEHR